MGLFKYLGAAAVGVVAIAAAPFTAGTSLALLLGTAGTITAAGAALGATGGLVTAATVDLLSGNGNDETEAFRNEAVHNKAARAASETKRADQAVRHRGEIEELLKCLADKTSVCEGLRRFRTDEATDEDDISALFMFASCLAREGGNIGPDTWSSIHRHIALLCRDGDAARRWADRWYRTPASFEETTSSLVSFLDHHSLRRLHLAGERIQFVAQTLPVAIDRDFAVALSPPVSTTTRWSERSVPASGDITTSLQSGIKIWLFLQDFCMLSHD